MSNSLQAFEVKERATALIKTVIDDLYKSLTASVSSKKDFKEDIEEYTDKYLQTLTYYSTIARSLDLIVFDIPPVYRKFYSSYLTVDKINLNTVGKFKTTAIELKDMNEIDLTVKKLAICIYDLAILDCKTACCCLILATLFMSR